MLKFKIPSFLSCIAVTGLAQAEFTYVDATLSNTTLAGTPFTLEPPANYLDDASDGEDGLWSYRLLSSFEGGAYFETDNGSPNTGEPNDQETTPDLITTIELPVAGTYRVVALLANNSGRRDIAARIEESPGDGDTFNRDNSLNADQDLVPLQIDFDASFSNGRGSVASAADLGTVTTTTDNEEIQIYVNGFASTSDLDDERTRYDGVGYELAVPATPDPEPEPTHRDVFIIAGQSNGDGRGFVADLTGPLAEYSAAQPEVMIYFSNPRFQHPETEPLYRNWVELGPGFSVATSSTPALPSEVFGPELSAAMVLNEEFENVSLIKVTRGGSPLGSTGDFWHPPIPNPEDVGFLYTEFITVVQEALQALEDAGDTYTLHGIYWHQGEGDSGRVSSYADLLDRFVQSVRRDLDQPNLRFIIGELAPERTVDSIFDQVQWQSSRDIRNASFVSSANMRTFASSLLTNDPDDSTHFESASVIAMGLRVGDAFIRNRRVLDFNENRFGISELDIQDDFTGSFGTAGLNQRGDFVADVGFEIIKTSDSGNYIGGLAIGDSAGGAEEALSAYLEGVLPLAGARSMKASFHANESDSTLLVAGWNQDSNNDGDFDVDETGLGMGLGNDGLFHIRVGVNEFVSSGISYEADHWYELTSTWSEPDSSGLSQVRLFATNLSTSLEVNGGAPIITTSAQIAPATWEGVGFLADRGMLDNIGIEGAGYSGWAENRYPTLLSGPNGDDDFDGIANAFEYAYGLDPFVADGRAGLPFPILDGDEVRISIPELPRAEDILVELFQSTDLLSWDLVEGTTADGFRNFVFPITEPQLFFSQEVEINE